MASPTAESRDEILKAVSLNLVAHPEDASYGAIAAAKELTDAQLARIGSRAAAIRAAHPDWSMRRVWADGADHEWGRNGLVVFWFRTELIVLRERGLGVLAARRQSFRDKDPFQSLEMGARAAGSALAGPVVVIGTGVVLAAIGALVVGIPGPAFLVGSGLVGLGAVVVAVGFYLRSHSHLSYPSFAPLAWVRRAVLAGEDPKKYISPEGDFLVDGRGRRIPP
jgi:hypothetical protein